MAGLTVDPLFLACTRPAMRYGVPHEGFMLNVLGSFFFGLVMGSPLYWGVFVVLHFPMRALTNWDHNFFRVLRLWAATKGAGMGADLYGGSALAPLPSSRARKGSEIPSSV